MYKFAEIGYEAYRLAISKGGDPDMRMPRWDDLSKEFKDAYLSIANAILTTIKTGSE